MDIVFSQSAVESASQGGVEDCRCKGESDDEERGDGADDSRSHATQSAEERKESNEDLDDGGDQSDDVGDEHPLGHSLVRIQPSLQLLAKELVHTRIIQTPHINRIKPKFIRMRRTKCNIITSPTSAIPLEIPVAVIPQVNMVEVLDIQR